MDNEQKYYNQVAQELTTGNIDFGVWARAIADTGDEGAKAKALYIKLRVECLKSLEQDYEAKSRTKSSEQQTDSPFSTKKQVKEGLSESVVLFSLGCAIFLIGLVSVSSFLK